MSFFRPHYELEHYDLHEADDREKLREAREDAQCDDNRPWPDDDDDDDDDDKE